MTETKPTTATKTPADPPAKAPRKPVEVVTIKLSEAKKLARALNAAASREHAAGNFGDSRVYFEAAHKLTMAIHYGQNGAK